MNSKVLFLVFAVGTLSVGSDPIYIERRTTDLGSLNTCLGQAYVDGQNNIDSLGGHASSEQQQIEIACRFLQRIKTCLCDIVEPPQIIRYTATWEWQHLVMAHKAGLCTHIESGKLRKIGLGVLKKQPDLVNIETLTYDEPCVRDVLVKCLTEIEKSFESQHNVVNPSFYYIECYQAAYDQPDGCKADMLREYLKYGKVVKQIRDDLEDGE